MVLGYIVSDKHLNIPYGFVRQVSSLGDADLTKPTLIIGYYNAKKLDGFVNILDKRIGEQLFWTFAKTEKKEEFDDDVEKFIKFVIDKYVSQVRYYYFNPFKASLSQIKKLLSLVKTNESSTIYISDKAIYVLWKDNIIGVSFNVLSYIGIDKEKIIKKIESNKSNRIIYDDTRLPRGLMSSLGSCKYALPFLITIK